ncbi:D-arabinono-1,4-lactone oxidase [Gordonia polyisoprenivorans]|uniref:D-arabinono-1,4-lactone oxidase n=1 Tax=Gordonia polyisoprenivorans TaxID=84595 RepID=UPI0026ACF931
MLPVTVASWRNWGGTAQCTPDAVHSPARIDDVVALVERAAQTHSTVKAVGAGHSFSPIAVAPQHQLDMSGLRGLVDVDVAARRVTLRAGTHLHELPALLGEHGLAMTNLGDVDRQTISGATSTGTHGTGIAFGGISTQIVGATLVSGTGEVVTVSEDDPDLAAVALGLGALGILVDLTMQCVPAFSIRAEEYPLDADDAIDGFLERVETQDHHEFYWFPHTNCALAKTNTRLDGLVEPSGTGAVRRYIDDEILSNRVYGAVCALGSRLPAVVPAMSQLSGRVLSARTFTDRSDTVFVSSRTVRFREMEYAVPLEATPSALHELRKMIDRKRYRVSFPVEVRAAAGDDLMLSTASGGPRGYIAVHRYHHDDPADSAAYFADAEAIMTAHGGRPHWGKMHTRDAEYLRSVYPRFDEFLAVRDRFDPDRVFTNPYLHQVLGS